MDQQVALVTGANRGIGFEVARGLAGDGFRTLVVARTAVKAEQAAADLGSTVDGPEPLGLPGDHASLSAVRELAARVLDSVDRLDALVLNAAAAPSRRTLTEDAYETQFQVNHLAGYLLMRSLYPLLRRTAETHGGARIVVVASEQHRRAVLDLDDPNFERRRYGKVRAYGASKLANVLSVYAVHRRIKGSGVTVNAVHPGTISTGLLGSMFGPLYPVRFLFRGPRSGAGPLIRLAAAPEVEGISGRYFERFDDVPSSEASYDQELQERLWSMSEALVGLSDGA